MLIKGITVIADQELLDEEIAAIVDDEIQLWQERSKTLGSVKLSLDGDNIVVTASEKSPIRRIRRITGYLSNLENFNDAKHSECTDRKVHAG
jgi:hypothetical protein